MSKIILSADSTCDIGPELAERYNVQFFHLSIILEDKSYYDSVEITPQEIYDTWHKKGVLPKTAAITPGEYADFFSQWVEDGYEVVHINIGSALSSSHQNATLAASELGSVYTVDSANLSSGTGLLVIQAGEMIAAGLSAKEIQKKLTALRDNVRASFVLDTLEFMKAGGRCSAITAFGANLLRLKPSIQVDQFSGGEMGVGKKYRGAMGKVLKEYVRDKISGRDGIDYDHVFITHSGSPQQDIDIVKEELDSLASFEEVHVTQASCTISSHCGPRTLGILFMVK